ncbi:hypothetical protein F383_37347 [Gossypium arboreum]|uniref:Uncharacterized protein n=1 Tax=Gossypium arboreum TaxID=29729 RepID=A0A0B0NF75_GOSAR|nr:hypothetical protein F383_37347 [Gossypium arboreum]
MTQRLPLHLLNILLQNHPFASLIFSRQFPWKQGKNRERTRKTGSADELNRGDFDGMSELKK